MRTLGPRMLRPVAAWIVAVLAVRVAVPEFCQGIDVGLIVQLLAPTLIALLAAVLASAFVATQVSVALYGARAGLLVLVDPQLLALVGRVLLLGAGVLVSVFAVRPEAAPNAWLGAVFVIGVLAAVVEAREKRYLASDPSGLG